MFPAPGLSDAEEAHTAQAAHSFPPGSVGLVPQAQYEGLTHLVKSRGDAAVAARNGVIDAVDELHRCQGPELLDEIGEEDWALLAFEIDVVGEGIHVSSVGP